MPIACASWVRSATGPRRAERGGFRHPDARSFADDPGRATFHHPRRRRPGRRPARYPARATRLRGRGVRAPPRPAPRRLCGRTLDQPRAGRTRPARTARGRPHRRGHASRGDDARAHGAPPRRPHRVAALRSRRQRSDLVDQPRPPQRRLDRCRRTRRRALPLRPPPARRGVWRRRVAALPRRRQRRHPHPPRRLRARRRWRRLRAARGDGRRAAARRAHRAARARLQGARNSAWGPSTFLDSDASMRPALSPKMYSDPISPSIALRHRTQRAAHLAARQLHVHRAAERRGQLHGHAVPRPPGRAELRHGCHADRRARVLRARLRRRCCR